MKNRTNINPESGKRLRAAREKENYSQTKLANEANCAVQLISGIENGKRPLTPNMAHTFAEILCTDEDYLMCEKDYQLMEILPLIQTASLIGQFETLPQICLNMCGIKILSVKTTTEGLTIDKLMNYISSYVTATFLETFYGSSDSLDESFYCLYPILNETELKLFYFNPYMTTQHSGEITMKAIELADYIADVTNYIRMRSEHMLLKASCGCKMSDLEAFQKEFPDLFNKIEKPDKI